MDGWTTISSDSPEAREKAERLYHVAKSGTRDELTAELNRQNLTTRAIDSIRVCGPGEPTSVDSNYPSTPVDVRQTLLQVACSFGNTSCVEALLKLGASPCARTPILVKLLSMGCYLDSEESGNESCMHLAAKADSSAGLIRLLTRTRAASGCENLVNARSQTDCTPLMLVASRYSRHFRKKMDGEWLSI